VVAIDAERNNLVVFNNKSVASAIQYYVERLAEDSPNTAKSFGNYIKEFFMAVKGKEINDLVWDDLISITNNDVVCFQSLLRRKNSKNTTNQKISAVKSLFRALKPNCDGINMNAFEIKPFKIKDNDVESYGSLTEDEVERLLEFAGKQSYRSLVQKLYFKTRFIAGIRHDAVFTLEWKQIKRLLDKKNNVEAWVIGVDDKGKSVKKAISDKFYEELCELKSYISEGEKNYNKNKVFNICDKYLRNTLREFCKVEGINEDRNIVLHSLKKSSCDYVYDRSKDITLTATQGQHSDINTTYNNYIGKNSGFIDQPSYYMFDDEVSIDKLRDLSKEELLDLIEKCGKGVIRQLIGKM
jgi:integrase